MTTFPLLLLGAMAPLALALALVTVGALVLAVLAASLAWRVSRRSPVRPHGMPPPVSILKPLKGIEEGLETNLASLAGQDYPGFEILCGIADPGDPAVAVAETFRARFPDIPIRVVIGIADLGYNPKVSNLAGLLPQARHELLLISDANVRVGPRYLADTVDALLAADAALASNLFVGLGERTFGAACENLHLATFVGGGVALASAAGTPCVVGKSMLLRRADLIAVGGLPAVADVLAEDYLLGKLLAESGRRVVLAEHVVGIHNPGRSLTDFLARQLRWAQMRFRIAPLAYLCEPLLSPTPFALALLAVGAGSGSPGAMALASGAIGGKLLLDSLLVRHLRGRVDLARDRARAVAALGLACSPLKDLLLLGVWALAMARHTVTWRGRRLRIGRGSRLSPLRADQAAGSTAGAASRSALEPA